MKPVHSIKIASKEDGAALIVGLVLLLAITLIAVAGMQNSTLQERMAGNLYDHHLAFQAAEGALRHAQATFSRDAAMPVIDHGNSTATEQELWDAYLRESGNVAIYNPSHIPAGTLASFPRYVIEELPPAEDLDLAADEVVTENRNYRVTVRAEGGTPGAVVILQSKFRR